MNIKRRPDARVHPVRRYFPSNQVSALSFLLEGDAIDYYHSLTKKVQDDWYELMRALGHRFDCISQEPVLLSQMLTLKDTEFTSTCRLRA